ncbi:MAG TPA: Gfo/Idh/MocA family oxidoreductase [Bacillota bacterium]|nr:Gfo/Idh/MocA family oxidoreductase [Bacillota bacterium]
MRDSINRRDFLKRAGVAGVGLGLASYLPSFNAAGAARRSIGPNDTLRVAVVGTNGRGLAHIECLTGLPGVEITHICDVDDRAIAKGIKQAVKGQKSEPKGIKDIRKLLEDKSLDAVTIATPDHWHAPMAIMALAAGKHVYLEKPCSHNPHEGELLIEAVRKYKGVFQMGNQRRSFPNMHQAMSELKGGIIGKAYFAKGWYDNRRASIGRGKAAPVPEWLDYELWQGPAPRREYRDNLVHYNWHWFWHWGTGEALNNGTHEIDVCRWALGVNWPSRVTSSGGRYQFQDDWETPDTQVISWDYAEGKTISWEGRSCNNYPVEGLDRGSMVYGTEGSMLLDGNNYTVFDKKNKKVKEVKGNEKGDATNTVSASGIGLDQMHVKNFLDGIRTGQPTHSPIEEGHKSVTMLHLGNIAWRTGRTLNTDPANGHIQNDPEAMKLWRRDYEPGWEPKV